MPHPTAPAGNPSPYRNLPANPRQIPVAARAATAVAALACLTGCLGLGGRGHAPDETAYLAPATDQPALVPYAMPARPTFAKELAHLTTSDIADFDSQPKHIRALIEASIALARKRLPYKYGADDPAEGGLDCSGFVHYALQRAGMRNIPRMSGDLCDWVKRAGGFHLVRDKSPATTELDALRPGDLLFWTHTRGTNRGNDVSHVKVYLGRRKSDNCPLMAGATNGRDKNGGGAIYEFFVEGTYYGYVGPGIFHGYGPVPGLKDGRLHGGFAAR